MSGKPSASDKLGELLFCFIFLVNSIMNRYFYWIYKYILVMEFCSFASFSVAILTLLSLFLCFSAVLLNFCCWPSLIFTNISFFWNMFTLFNVVGFTLQSVSLLVDLCLLCVVESLSLLSLFLWEIFLLGRVVNSVECHNWSWLPLSMISFHGSCYSLHIVVRYKGFYSW